MRTGPTVTLLCLALLAGAGCKKNKKAQENPHLDLGEQVAKADASDLRATPDGAHALYLVDGEKPRIDGIPPQMLIGELYALPTSGGAPRPVGGGVTNMPGGYTFSPDSRWVLFLSGYNAASQKGTLRALDLTDPASDPVELGTDVTYMIVSPDSKQVAFVAEHVLHLGPLPAGPFRKVAGEVQTAEFAPDSGALVYKRRLTAAGGLFRLPLSPADAEPKKLGEQVGDYLISPDSGRVAFIQRSEVMHSTYDLFLASAPKWETKQVAVGTGAFAFSPDAKWLGRTEGKRPDKEGDLFVGPADGSRGRKVGKGVDRFQFSPASNAVAYLELYDVSARAGVLGVAALPDGAPKRVGNRVPNFDWSPDGKSVAFITRVLKPIYSIDLMLFELGAKDAFKVHPGVFGYNYDPRARYLVFRTNCLNQGRMCDLMKVDLAKAKEPPKKILEGIYTFRPTPDGDRILVTYTRRDSKLYDTAVFNVGKNERKTVGQYLELPPILTPTEPHRVVYVVPERGVFLATRVP